MKYAIFNGEKITLNTKKEYDAFVEKHGTHSIVSKKEFDAHEVVLEEAPKMEIDINDLPPVINVRNKKTKQEFEVRSDYYLRYQSDLELA